MDNPLKKMLYIGLGVFETLREQAQKVLSELEEKGKRSDNFVANQLKDMADFGYKKYEERKEKVEETIKTEAKNTIIHMAEQTLKDSLKTVDQFFKSVNTYMQESQKFDDDQKPASPNASSSTYHSHQESPNRSDASVVDAEFEIKHDPNTNPQKLWDHESKVPNDEPDSSTK